MIFTQAIAFLLDPDRAPLLLQRIGESLWPTLISVVVVAVIAVPVGFAIGHTGRGRTAAIVAGNAARALPTLGLLSILILLLGIHLLPVVVVLVILGIPPMLAGSYSGVEAVDRQTTDAARAMGMTERQVVARVEWPLAAPLVVGGLRSTALQVFATTTVASQFAFGGLGRYLIDGIASADYVQVTAGAIIIAAVALVIEGGLALVQRLVEPRGLASASPGRRSRRRGSARAEPSTA